MKKIYLFTIVSFFILVGCGGSKNLPQSYLKKEKLPSWYLSVQQNDGKYLYSTGEGETKKEAVASALANLVSTFQVTVESSFESKKEMDTFVSNNVYKKIDKRTKLKTNAIQIRNYEVSKIYEESFDKILVQIKVDKQKLATQTDESIKNKIQKANQSIALHQNDGFIEKYKNYKKLYEQNDEISNDLKLLDYLNYNYDKSYENFISNIEEKYFYYKKNLIVKVEFDKSSKNFKTSINAYLVSKKISFEGSNSSSDLKIEVTTKKSNSKAMGLNLDIFEISLALLSANKTINTKTIVLKEVNRGDDRVVYKNANIHLLKQLEENKVFKENFDFE